MKLLRRVRLVAVSACLCAPWIPRLAAQAQPPAQQQQPPAEAKPGPQQTPQQPARPQTPAPARQASPFENVPRDTSAPPPAQPAAQPGAPGQQLEAPKAPELPLATGQYVEAIEFRGSRRVPQDTLRAMLITKSGDLYNEEILRRDFMALWNTSRFDDLRLETEPGRTGLIIRFVVTERRVIRTIDYVGIHSVTVSEILDRFKERKVGLSVETQYDPAKIQRASVVLLEFLGERGHEYATVDPVLEQIPPSSLKLTFNVKEGPKVKVGSINVTGNNAISDRTIIRHMKLLKPIGIPHSIVFENIFAKTFDTNKLEYDKEMIRQEYMNRGYFMAKVMDEKVEATRKGGQGWRLPIFKMNMPGIYANITLPVEEGKQFHLNTLTVQGVKFFRTPEALMGSLLGMNKGDVFSVDKLKKGMEKMRKLYGAFGFIDFVPEPDPMPVPNTDQIDLTITADEGKRFFIRRIDFSGNSTTRDKVIRRELLLDEGDMFNMDLWEMSILRLNQLGYFEMLKKEEAAEVKRNSQSDTVDITLKVKERGKNTIGMNGGVSGIAGSFLGFNYSTNNFLGLGETLSLDAQLGTRMRDVSLGFTEPYLFDRPIQAGFVVYLRRFNFDQGREASILSGTNLMPLYQSLGSSNLLNYSQNSKGFSVSTSTHLRRSFAQIGLTYGYDNSNIITQTDAAKNYFSYINFTGVAGPNSLNGIKMSHITPSYSYNTVNHPITPNAGRSVYFSVDFAGSVLGGNVNTIRPSLDLKYFKQIPWHRSHVLGVHVLASMITGYGGKLVPPYSRTFIGGEQDIRGFEIWGVSPVAFIPTSANVPIYNDDGSARTQKTIVNGKVTDAAAMMTIPSYQVITPGGDTQVVSNVEYRIPLAGPVTLSAFFDAGINKILISNQLNMVQTHVDDMNAQFPQAGFDQRVRISPGTQKIRASTGLEVSVMLPIVQAPFRVYFAYNPSLLRGYLQPPIVADRASFPNNTTFYHSVASFGQPISWFEKRTMFRFTIGKTF
jgi:outer membrane protein insertion porin family